ncbi:hypothetical protein DFP73DRAFT_610055 [Morchella snyderi]|nr:hypothetical protein DFP73DRAFT_610055 [Morchella snyderi]
MTNTANGFRNVAAEMDNASTEIDKIQNMAAANIVRQLTQMQAQLNRMEQGQQNILRQLSRSENNNLARLFNSRVADKTHRLEPLYDMNNELIADFPQTSADINELNGSIQYGGSVGFGGFGAINTKFAELETKMKNHGDLKAEIKPLVWQVRVLLGGAGLVVVFLVKTYLDEHSIFSKKQAHAMAQVVSRSADVQKVEQKK